MSDVSVATESVIQELRKRYAEAVEAMTYDNVVLKLALAEVRAENERLRKQLPKSLKDVGKQTALRSTDDGYRVPPPTMPENVAEARGV